MKYVMNIFLYIVNNLDLPLACIREERGKKCIEIDVEWSELKNNKKIFINIYLTTSKTSQSKCRGSQ